MSDEPAPKKVKTGFEEHTLNISTAIMKDDEGKHFTELIAAEVSTMQGIGPKSAEVAAELNISTVEDLANYKYFKWARALATLAETEVEGDRPGGSMMNVNKMVDKAYETKTLKEIVEAPVAALQGVSDAAGSLLAELHVHTVGDLATFKYCRYAEAIVQAAQYEDVGTDAERKAEREAAKLS
uniref:Uncharacterized protein n=1 Tax=Minutocellus polymorphus TaxID=265543 RepID=A0A7S0FNT0_9STRA|eukprot:CAMPEP_0197717098 /NCGR_PEP_ID=MMETSP1434-20131217/1766_1 /TAXON_ID=265543 /ORGANISM="Minutocellus polymorphus, Strain CCMP3303" /LENGTH=182 /DNA_ID=CAMNT_0043301583 /DNA_START=95 /DNA_END=643 /DNA_ORIENTATION=+